MRFGFHLCLRLCFCLSFSLSLGLGLRLTFPLPPTLARAAGAGGWFLLVTFLLLQVLNLNLCQPFFPFPFAPAFHLLFSGACLLVILLYLSSSAFAFASPLAPSTSSARSTRIICARATSLFTCLLSPSDVAKKIGTGEKVGRCSYKVHRFHVQIKVKIIKNLTVSI